MNNSMEFRDFIEKMEKCFEEKIEERKFIDKDAEFSLEGPNIIFASHTLQFRFSTMKFKEDSVHTLFSNLLGEINIIVDFKFSEQRFETELSESFLKLIDNKIDKALQITRLLYQENIFQSDSESYLKF